MLRRKKSFYILVKRGYIAMAGPTAGFSVGWLALGILLIYTVMTRDGNPILYALILMCIVMIVSLFLYTTCKGGR